MKVTFSRIREDGIKLKPEKYTFGVIEGKFLGYLISYEGIRPHPEKVEAITKMEAPKTLKELQKLNGKVAALNRFIPRSADKCRSFFNILRNPSKKIEWSEECKEAFSKLKTALKELPTLQAPNPDEPLYLYVASSETTISAVLVTENDKIQKPVFYFSRTLQGAENRYPPLEKLVLAVIASARQLRAYFQAHSIIIPTNFPLLQTLHKPDMSGRLAKWVIELSGYDIKFVPAKAIKAQVLADFIAELTPDAVESCNMAKTWNMEVDGSAGKNGCGAGIILISPEGLRLEKSLHFNFKTTNNAVEYEALIVGLDLAKGLKIKSLVINTDSQFVANQIQGSYEVNEQSLKDYREASLRAIGDVSSVRINLVKRKYIEEADILAKLGAAKNSPQGEWIQVSNLNYSSIQEGKMNLEIIESKEDWRKEIITFIRGDKIQKDRFEERKIRNQAAHYILQEQEFYRRETSNFSFRKEEGKKIAPSIHNGGGGAHQ